MDRKYAVGIDVGSENFVACVLSAPDQVVLAPKEFGNHPEGVQALLDWLQSHRVGRQESMVCLEATGVYGENLAYLLSAQDWWLAVQPPLEIKRAFKPVGPKTDAVDSRQIAEYALRYRDRLRRWQPQKALLEQVKVLLNLREQYVRQRTAHRNALLALKRKIVRTPLAEQLHAQSIQQLQEHIQTIENEIRQLFQQDPDLHQNLTLLLTIPGVGLLLAAQTLLALASLQAGAQPKALAAYAGICPFENNSGSSIRHRATSRHYGPAAMRKLLHLGARSVRTHHPQFRQYFERKKAEGKPPQLILNNIANKLLMIMFAVLRDQQPYNPTYRSVHPQLYRGALTKS